MNLGIEVPKSAFPYITRQRTEITANVAEEYGRSIRRDYRQIEPFLPDTCESILDIGCGVAGIDVLLKRRYPNAELRLMDGDGDDKTRMAGFGETMRPFANREVTEALLRKNRIPFSGWVEPGTKEKLTFDLVISLLSCGWHYPATTYDVDAKLVIYDIRYGTDPGLKMKATIISPVIYKGKYKGDRMAFC